MNTKKAVTNKKQPVAVKDLKTRKNPKGGAETVHLYLKANSTSIKAPGKKGITGIDDWEAPVV